MRRATIFLLCAMLSLLLLLMACSGSSSSSSTNPGTGNVNAIVSDDASQDWATIGVKVLSITLAPQGGGTPVSIYTAPSSGAPLVNLVQLDQLGEIIGNASIPAGTYSQATITVSGNPSDITLTSAADPEPGFPYTTPTTVGQTPNHDTIQVVGASGSPLTVPVTVNLSPALAVGSGSNALDLEFDLSHPAFLVEHVSATGTFWAVNFNPMLRHHPIRDITQLVLRHLYGTNIAVSSDDTSFTMNKIFLPVPAPATVTNSSVAASTASVQILADNNNFTGNNGTIFWNLDPSPQRSVITSFASVASILSQPGEFVRVQARYGYMEPLRLEPILRACAAQGLQIKRDETSFFFYSNPKIEAAERGLPRWQRWLFKILQRNSRPLPDDLGIHAENRVELGVTVAI